MNRRDFLRTGAFATASPIALFVAQENYAGALSHNVPHPVSRPIFTGPAELTPLRGFTGQDVSCDAASIEGRLPAALRGVFYRNGPGLFERGGQRYQHWFDGDGLVHAWKFTGQGVAHRARFVQTSKFAAESAADSFLVPAFGTAITARIPVRGPDTLNTANTNALRVGKRLLALWEGGSAYEMDPESLATIGPVTWQPELKGMPFSAHPKVEADGTMWNFGTLMGKMIVYQISAQGELLRHAVFDAPAGAMVHDFAVSRRHLVFLLPPISLDMEALRAGAGFSQSMRWKAGEALQVLVVDKSDFGKRRTFEVPAFMVFHFGNAWEANGVIRIDFVQSADLGETNDWMQRTMRGELVESEASNAAFMTIDLVRGRVGITRRDEQVEFPRVDPRLTALRNRFVFYTTYSGNTTRTGFFNSIMRLDVDSGKTDTFSFEKDCIVEEHIVVPKPGATREQDAWLVGAGFDIARQQSFASVFDAANLAAGPVALARLPYWLPHCFHGNFHAA